MKKIFVIAQIAIILCCLGCKQSTEQKPGQDSNKPSSTPPVAELKSLVVKQGGKKLKDVNSPIPDGLTIRLEKKVSEASFTITATPKDSNAKIYFDGNTNSETAHTYNTFQAKVVIKVKNGSASKSYTLNIEEPGSPVPQPNPPTPSVDDEVALKNLVINQGVGEIEKYVEPISTVLNIALPKRVNNANNKLKISAEVKTTGALIKFDSDTTSKTSKEYDSFQTQVKITVSKNTKTAVYILNFTQPDPKASTLKKLEIKQNSKTIEKFENDVPTTANIKATSPISSSSPLIVEAWATDSASSVIFDSDSTSSTSKQYTSHSGTITIKCENEDGSTIYTLNVEDGDAPPTPPQPEPEHTAKLNVVDSIGGSNVEGVKVIAYKAGTTQKVQESETDANGNAYFTIAENVAYDFVLSKKGRAGSRLENAYIPKKSKRILPVIMRDAQIGAKAIAPEIKEVKLLKRVSGQWQIAGKLTDNFEIDCSTLQDNFAFYLETISKSEEIIPEKTPNWNNNNGIGMSMGSPFRHDETGFLMLEAGRVQLNSQGDRIEYGAGFVRQAFSFIHAHSYFGALDGEITLYFIAYDAAGNRCERQERINIKNGGLKDKVDTRHNFEVLQATSKRYYRSLATFETGDVELFGMPKEKDTPTSLDVEFLFKLNEKISIGRIDIFRREYKTGDITEGWKCAYTKQYESKTTGTSNGVFMIRDDSGTLEEGKTYQYKLVAYGESGKIVSNVATLRVMEAFNLVLTSPAPRATLKLENVANQDFSFRISDSSLWNKKKSDYFSFGILIVRDECGEYTDNYGNPVYEGLCFATKLKYDFNESGKGALLLAGAAIREDEYDYRPYHTLAGSSSLELGDIFAYSEGKITLKSKFFENASFNTFGNKALKDTMYGGIYYWDVPNMKKNLLIERYDRGVAFVKEYPFLDATTGQEVPSAGKSVSSSFSNLDRSGGAVNGRAVFSVIDKN